MGNEVQRASPGCQCNRNSVLVEGNESPTSVSLGWKRADILCNHVMEKTFLQPCSWCYTPGKSCLWERKKKDTALEQDLGKLLSPSSPVYLSIRLVDVICMLGHWDKTTRQPPYLQGGSPSAKSCGHLASPRKEWAVPLLLGVHAA